MWPSTEITKSQWDHSIQVKGWTSPWSQERYLTVLTQAAVWTDLLCQNHHAGNSRAVHSVKSAWRKEEQAGGVLELTGVLAEGMSWGRAFYSPEYITEFSHATLARPWGDGVGVTFCYRRKWGELNSYVRGGHPVEQQGSDVLQKKEQWEIPASWEDGGPGMTGMLTIQS